MADAPVAELPIDGIRPVATQVDQVERFIGQAGRRHVLVLGGPDTGKSYLVDALAEKLADRGPAVAVVDADPGQSRSVRPWESRTLPVSIMIASTNGQMPPMPQVTNVTTISATPIPVEPR